MTHVEASAATERAVSTRSRYRLDPAIVAAVFVGGFFGGAARYVVGEHWSTAAGSFPWSTFAVNVSGAFVLALLAVLVVEVFPPTKLVRPALGTGFLGAYTTFSSLVVAADELGTHGHLGTAVAYVAASTAAGVAAAVAGISLARSVARRGTP